MEKIRIFLTDDNDEIRAALHKYLEAQEDMIISGEAANGVEALQRLPECPSDVIILDLIMPQMDGFGVLEQVQRIPPEQRPRVIALTALGREDFIARALRLPTGTVSSRISRGRRLLRQLIEKEERQ